MSKHNQIVQHIVKLHMKCVQANIRIYLNTQEWTEWISEYICIKEKPQIWIKIIFVGQYIQIFKYVCSSLVHSGRVNRGRVKPLSGVLCVPVAPSMGLFWVESGRCSQNRILHYNPCVIGTTQRNSHSVRVGASRQQWSQRSKGHRVASLCK